MQTPLRRPGMSATCHLRTREGAAQYRRYLTRSFVSAK